MAVIQDGTTEAVASVAEGIASALHIVAKPQPYGDNGHYQVAIQTGLIGAGLASNAELFQFRWTNTARSAHITRVMVTGMRSSGFDVGGIDLKLTRATSWTAAGTGGTSLTLSAPNFTLRQGEMDLTGVADLRIATTVALGAGTKTLDTYDHGQITSHSSAGWVIATPIVGSVYLPTLDLFRADLGSGEHPLSLDAYDGFVVRAVVPGTGAWNLGLLVKWSEPAEF